MPQAGPLAGPLMSQNDIVRELMSTVSDHQATQASLGCRQVTIGPLRATLSPLRAIIELLRASP